jgi:hypothetical protein
MEESTPLHISTGVRWWLGGGLDARRRRRGTRIGNIRLLGDTLALLTRLYDPLCKEIKEPTTTHGDEMITEMLTHLLGFR